MTIDELLRAARADGWQAMLTNGGHWRITAPNGAFVFAPSTGSDQRGVRNTIANMRRAWPEWRQRRKRPVDARRKRVGRPAAPAWHLRWSGFVCRPVMPHGATLADVWPR